LLQEAAIANVLHLETVISRGKIMKKNVAIAALLCAFLGVSGFWLYSYRLFPNAKLTRVTVTGESQTQVSPDNAVVTFSVITKDKQAVNAQQQNASKTDAVINALKLLTANNSAEIKTDNYRLDSEENYTTNSLSKILGYEAQNTITITTPDLNQVGALIDAATKAGANGVEGINFILREDSPNQGKSLGISTRQAMAKAEAIAESLGGRIYRVVEAQEGGITPRPSQTENYAANSAASVDYKRTITPVMAGSLNVHSQILLVVEVETK
jgi:uncharacterized protein